MNRRWRILILAATCAAVVIVAVLAWPREREPEYKGRKLSAWTHRVYDPKLQPADKAERIEAVQHIGTSALPYLLKWIEGSEFVKPVRKFDAVAIRIMTKATARRWLDYKNRKFYRGAEACWAIEVLGTNAIPAVPELVKLSHSTNGWVNSLARDALKRFGRDATGALLDYTKDPNASAWTHWTNLTDQIPSTNTQAPDKLQIRNSNSH